MKQKKVYLLAGIAGSGKSTWAKRQIAKNHGSIFSRDSIRFELLKKGEDYFAHEDEVLDRWYALIAAAINNPNYENIYVDATHLSDKSRKATINTFPKGDYDIELVVFDIPLETCLKRNEMRSGRAYVPPQTIHRMYAGFQKTSAICKNITYITEANENE